MNTATDTACTVVEARPAERHAMPAVVAESAVMAAQSATPSSLLQLAISQNADLDRLERLMRMQIEWESNEARKAFRRDFAAFRGENIVIPKSKFVDRGRAGSFWQAEYDEVCTKLSPALSKHGFSFRHDQKFGSRKWVSDGVENDIPWVYVTCFLEHKDGHTETLTLEGPPGDQSANTEVQNMQVTASLLKRQSLLAITGTATGAEDDESKLCKGQASDPAGEQAGVDAAQKLIAEGNEAAKKGMKELTAWWSGLTPRQQKDMSKDFGAMRRVARTADERTSHE